MLPQLIGKRMWPAAFPAVKKAPPDLPIATWSSRSLQAFLIFKTGAFNHSATPPDLHIQYFCRSPSFGTMNSANQAQTLMSKRARFYWKRTTTEPGRCTLRASLSARTQLVAALRAVGHRHRRETLLALINTWVTSKGPREAHGPRAELRLPACPATRGYRRPA